MHKHSLMWLWVFGLIVAMFLRLPPMVARQDTVLNAYRALVEADALAKQRYVEPINDERLVDGAIRGMMFELDPYSGYISEDELSDFQRHSRGDYTGLGLEIGFRDGRPVVITPVEGSPAAEAGVLAGDVILSVNGWETEGLSVFEIDELLGGRMPRGRTRRAPPDPKYIPAAPPGSGEPARRGARDAVRLVVSRSGEDEPREVRIQPGHVSIRTIRGFRRLPDGRWDYLLDPARGIGYARVSNFTENTVETLREALDELRAQGAGALILDLRFNPGGLLEEGVELVDEFLADGLVVSTVTRRQVIRTYRARPGQQSENLRLAVLVNGASASASEIVAGALQDHHRAVVVGERTFGKGSVQQLMFLQSNHAAIKLTIAYYRLPGGQVIHRGPKAGVGDPWGVQPDLPVGLTADEVRAVQQARHALDVSMPESSVGANLSRAPGHQAAAGGRADSLRAAPESRVESVAALSPTPTGVAIGTRELVRDRQLQAAWEVLVGGSAAPPDDPDRQ
ncbi:MAG: S41 family peptidase [Planctomycetes bacterium]|nr:S41 family peptidase [Planctomycetota bacterium]